MKKLLLLFLIVHSITTFSQINNLFEDDFCKIVEHESAYAKKIFIQQKSNHTNKVDVNYYRLDCFATPDSIYISGNVTIYFSVVADSTSDMILDLAGNMNVDSVIFHSGNTPFTHVSASDELQIHFQQMLYKNDIDSVTVYYNGYPSQSGFGAFTVTSHSSGDVLWTLSEPYGAKEWWPNKQNLIDKADSIDVIITTTFGNKVASNGVLLKIDTLGNNFHRYHWSSNYPIAAYLIAIGITNYEVFKSQIYFPNDSLDFVNYLYPGDSVALANSTFATGPFMHLFDSLVGVYPFMKEKYGHASFGFGGGMEHQTMSFMGNYSGSIIAHELAHQWFGDAITCGSWRDIWLNEGFATYLTGLTYEFDVVHSKTYWHAWKSGTRGSALSQPHGSVWVDDTTSVNRIFSPALSYSKGAYLLHMLRWKMGDSAFFAGVKNYMSDPVLLYGFAKTDDLKMHLETSSGMNLTEFFDDWFYGSGFPYYSISWTNTLTGIDINIIQSQSDTSVSFFDIPLPIVIEGANQDTLLRLEPTQSPQSYSIPLPFQAVDVKFNPDLNILTGPYLITTLNEEDTKNNIEVYPNPTNSLIFLNVDESIKINGIEIYDTQGKMVFNSPFQTQISIGTFPPSIYFIHLKGDEQSYRFKIVKN